MIFVTNSLKKIGHRNLFLTESDKSAVLMVSNERADAFLFYDSTFSIYMKKMNLDQNIFKRVFKTIDLSGASLYLAINKESDPNLIKNLSMELEKSKQSGKFDMTIRKFNALTSD